MSDAKEKAPKGKVWMCPACGRWAVHREDVGDVACYMAAGLVTWDKERHVVRKQVTP
jgi:hypothetical protein